jgi:dsDNA-specific endonuclease/ATPase MutS2
VRGTIAAIDGDTAEVVGAGGLRVRIPLARLRPDAPSGPSTEPRVRVLASARGDVSDELDVRGCARRRRVSGARVRRRAALAGLPSVRVVHGRGTGPCGTRCGASCPGTGWWNGTSRTPRTAPRRHISRW